MYITIRVLLHLINLQSLDYLEQIKNLRTNLKSDELHSQTDTNWYNILEQIWKSYKLHGETDTIS